LWIQKREASAPEASSGLLGDLLVCLFISLLILVGGGSTLAWLTTRVLLSSTLALLLVVPFPLRVFLGVLLGRILLSRLPALLFFVIHF
jgi:hypothetical protein